MQRSPPSGPIGLQTSGRELREMLEKSGARHRLEGAEKLDFLVWLADQVKGSVEERRRMKLKLTELNELLARERVTPDTNSGQLDAKGAVSGLLALRRRELARLSYDADRTSEYESGDACFELVLAEMPAQDVRNCFSGEVVLYDTTAASCGGGPVGGLLPGQIASPRSAWEPQLAPESSPRYSNSPAASASFSGHGGGGRHGGRPDAEVGSRRPPPPPGFGNPPAHFLPTGVPPPPPFKPSDCEEASHPVPGKVVSSKAQKSSGSCSLM